MLLCSSYYQNDIYREKVDQVRFSMYNFNRKTEVVKGDLLVALMSKTTII